MREKLTEYVRNLFRYAPNNQHNRELEEEILQNSLDRYDDLVAGGLPEDEAYRQTVANLGDVRPLLETEELGPVESQRTNRRRSGWIAAGVIGGVAVLAIVIVACLGLYAPRSFGGRQKEENWTDQVEQNVENWADQLENSVEQWADGLAGAVIGSSTFTYANSDRYTAGGAEVSADRLQKLEIDWLAGSVTVELWDGDTVSFSEQGEDLEEDRQLHWLQDDETLHIRYCAAGKFQNLPAKDLLVRVPSGVRLEKLSVSGTSADVRITDVAADHLKFDSTSGDLEAWADCEMLSADTTSGGVRFTGTAGQADVSTTSGSLSFEGHAERAEFESTSGSLTFAGTVVKELKFSTISGSGNLDLDATPEELSFDSTSASLTLALPGERSFEAELDTVSGSFHCDFPTTTEDRDTWIYDAGDRKAPAELDFDTVSGSVDIRKK